MEDKLFDITDPSDISFVTDCDRYFTEGAHLVSPDLMDSMMSKLTQNEHTAAIYITMLICKFLQHLPAVNPLKPLTTEILMQVGKVAAVDIVRQLAPVFTSDCDLQSTPALLLRSIVVGAILLPIRGQLARAGVDMLAIAGRETHCAEIVRATLLCYDALEAPPGPPADRLLALTLGIDVGEIIKTTTSSSSSLKAVSPPWCATAPVAENAHGRPAGAAGVRTGASSSLEAIHAAVGGLSFADAQRLALCVELLHTHPFTPYAVSFVRSLVSLLHFRAALAPHHLAMALCLIEWALPYVNGLDPAFATYITTALAPFVSAPKPWSTLALRLRGLIAAELALPGALFAQRVRATVPTIVSGARPRILIVDEVVGETAATLLAASVVTDDSDDLADVSARAKSISATPDLALQPDLGSMRGRGARPVFAYPCPYGPAPQTQAVWSTEFECRVVLIENVIEQTGASRGKPVLLPRVRFWAAKCPDQADQAAKDIYDILDSADTLDNKRDQMTLLASGLYIDICEICDVAGLTAGSILTGGAFTTDPVHLPPPHFAHMHLISVPRDTATDTSAASVPEDLPASVRAARRARERSSGIDSGLAQRCTCGQPLRDATPSFRPQPTTPAPPPADRKLSLVEPPVPPQPPVPYIDTIFDCAVSSDEGEGEGGSDAPATTPEKAPAPPPPFLLKLASQASVTISVLAQPPAAPVPAPVPVIVTRPVRPAVVAKPLNYTCAKCGEDVTELIMAAVGRLGADNRAWYTALGEEIEFSDSLQRPPIALRRWVDTLLALTTTHGNNLDLVVVGDETTLQDAAAAVLRLRSTHPHLSIILTHVPTSQMASPACLLSTLSAHLAPAFATPWIGTPPPALRANMAEGAQVAYHASFGPIYGRALDREDGASDLPDWEVIRDHGPLVSRARAALTRAGVLAGSFGTNGTEGCYMMGSAALGALLYLQHSPASPYGLAMHGLLAGVVMPVFAPVCAKPVRWVAVWDASGSFATYPLVTELRYSLQCGIEVAPAMVTFARLAPAVAARPAPPPPLCRSTSVGQRGVEPSFEPESRMVDYLSRVNVSVLPEGGVCAAVGYRTADDITPVTEYVRASVLDVTILPTNLGVGRAEGHRARAMTLAENDAMDLGLRSCTLRIGGRLITGVVRFRVSSAPELGTEINIRSF